jgi:hypothetical protein
VKDDLKQTGLPDTEVYALAAKHRRLIVTYNSKDFRRLVHQSQETGVIGIGVLVPYHHIDTKLTALLTRSSEKALFGKYTPLSEAA